MVPNLTPDLQAGDWRLLRLRRTSRARVDDSPYYNRYKNNSDAGKPSNSSEQLAFSSEVPFLEPALSRTLSSGGTFTHGHLLAISNGVEEITKPKWDSPNKGGAT